MWLQYDTHNCPFQLQVDSQGRATIVHMDIKANQFILINGTYKLNDFNMCEFLRWDPEEEEYCAFDGGYVGRVSGTMATALSESCIGQNTHLTLILITLQWQAPEQISHRRMLDDEKSDVFSLGYVLYYLLTGDQQWHSDSSDDAAKWALHGVRPEIPDSLLESKHPFDVAAIKAIKACLRHDPKDRPTAREVADFLHDALLKANITDAPLTID